MKNVYSLKKVILRNNGMTNLAKGCPPSNIRCKAG